MAHAVAYDSDLAFIHDSGFGDFARNSAPGILNLLVRGGISDGTIVDLGCGSGIWAKELADSGYRVIGVDISPAMIAIARRRVPEAEFHVKSFLQFRLPACQAVTALGEVFNYLFDEGNSLRSLRRLFKGVFNVLPSKGIFVFDVAEPGRCKGLQQGFRESEGWACLVQYQHEPEKQRLTRRIVTFRKSGKAYRRHEETHHQQLYQGASLAGTLRDIGFQVRIVRNYGAYRLPDHVVGVVARRP
ncbi:MAG: class I SAM-dependent DNA methyltransferase [Pirellulaceae bacterium]